MDPSGFAMQHNAHMLMFMLQGIKSEAEQAVLSNQYITALGLYTRALEMTPCLPMSCEEIPKILCNRSLVLTKLYKYQEALSDAKTCLDAFPYWIKGYWRASQAYKGMNLPYEALRYQIEGLNMCVEQECPDEDHISFLAEIVSTIVQINDDPEDLLEDTPLPSSNQYHTKILQKLSRDNCWEGVSLMVLGIHSGPISGLDELACNCQMQSLSVGSLIQNVKTNDMKKWGVKLAITMLKRGATCEDIEFKMGRPALLVGVQVALDTGMVDLLKYLFSAYIKTQDKKDARDKTGNTGFHLLVKSGKINTQLGETILRLLKNNGCNPIIKDVSGRSPIQYLSNKDIAYTMLCTAEKAAEQKLLKEMNALKERGNQFYREQSYQKALQSYNEAMALLAETLQTNNKDWAVLYSNRSMVYSGLDNNDLALEDAVESIRCDPTWNKGHWRRGQVLRSMGQHREAYSAFLEGFHKSQNIDMDVRCNFLVEAAKSFTCISAETLMDQSYKGLQGVPAILWSSVINKLSRTGDWIAIRYLVLGTEKTNQNGVARFADCRDVMFSTVFSYLHQQKSSRTQKWLTDLVVVLLNNGAALLNFREDDKDTPVHASVKFSLLTGTTKILDDMPDFTGARDIVDKHGDSPFHIITKQRPTSDIRVMTMVAKVLIHKRFSPDILDRNKMLAVQYITPQQHKLLYDVLIKVTKPPPMKATPSTNSSTRSRAQSSQITDMKQLKDRGNEEFSKGNMKEALQWYTEAIDVGLQSKKCGHDLAVLYGNRAECYLKLGLNTQAFDDAVESVSHDGHWYKGHLRVGRAQNAMCKYEPAAKALANAFNALDKSTSENIKIEILVELAAVYVKLDKRKYDPTKQITMINDMKSDLWAKVSYELVCKNQWTPAGCAYLQFQGRDVAMVSIKLDLKPLCNLSRVDSESWVLDLMKYFILCGSDHKSITVQTGDRYIHAVVRLSLAAGVLHFLNYLLEEVVKPASEQNLLDYKGNTALHVATKDQRAEPFVRLQAVALLLDSDINPLLKNNEGKLAIEYLPMNEGQTAQMIVQYMHIREALEKGMKQQKSKEKQKKEQQRLQQEEKKIQQEQQRQEHEQRRRQQERERQQQQQKRQNVQTQTTGSFDQSRTKPVQNNVNQCLPCEKTYSESCEHVMNESKKLKYVYTDLAHILRMKHKGDKHTDIQNKIITLIVNSLGSTLNPDIPEKLAKISEKLYRSIIEGLAEKEKWRQMDTAVQEYRRYHGNMAMRDFAKKLNIPRVIKHSTFKGSEALLVQIIDNMLDSGGELEKDGKLAVLACIQEEHFKALAALLRRGVSPVHLTLTVGDTPVHAALAVALERDKGNFSILNLLLDMFEKDPKNNPSLDPQQQDERGDGLFHVIARAKYNSTSQKATELLCDRKVSSAVCNKEGKQPYQYLNKNDRRLQFFRLASVGGDPKPFAPKKSKSKTSNRSSPLTTPREESPKDLISKIPNGEEDLLLYDRSDETKPVQAPDVTVKKERVKNVTKKEAIKRRIEEMIFELPEVPYSIFTPKKQRIEEGLRRAEEENRAAVDKAKTSLNFDKDKNSVEEEGESVENKTDNNEDIIESDDNDEEDEDEKVDGSFEVDVQVFDNLEWEVECTADVWKTLHDKKVIPELKHRVVRKIQLLASGEWRPHLCKKVIHDTPDTLKLYEAKLSKGSRIIWELAVAFSPRLSETAERRLQVEESDTEQPVKGGRIYSEVIRVWDITFDHNKIYRTVQKIVKSHNRGESCIIQKKLKGIKQTQFQAGARKRLPMIFAETELEMDQEKLKEYQQELQQYFPPASSNETEYHILKFYSFSSNLVSHILQNIEMKVDFPFRVTDLEHAIINLQSHAPILLLGRSGTGKTTCCLYRLWSQFLTYWSKAKDADAPLLPRCIQFIPQDMVDGKKEGDTEGEQDEEDNEEEAVETVQCKQDINQNEAPVAMSTMSAASSSGQYVGDEFDELDEEAASEGGQIYDHLHQIFITKNGVLCTEVQKNFRELSHACDIAANHVAMETQNLPNRFQDVVDFQFPLFVTSRQLLLMLDASLDPPYFFDRNEDGSLKVDVHGWTDDGPLSFLPLLDEDSDFEEEEEPGQFEDADDDVTVVDAPIVTRKKQKSDPRREVTYDVFVEEVWPRISKKYNNKYHPSLIWTEIMSFIKGSFEALSQPCGYLSKDEYKDLGRKRAPNFSSERDNIYELFRRYMHFSSQKFFFDETDLVFQVYNRLKSIKSLSWIVHQVFVDETQDFTQAELCLLMRICQNPNQMFLTGDTAQSIMRGIAFRFSDLRSLFFYASQSMQAVGKTSAIEVPKQVYQLTHNYRSHAGILSLASSILDLMVEFFPESFDRLEKDQGLFDGPAPVLLESCSFSDLAMLLRGNKRKTSHIEFGAHQAILVVNNAARDNIPEELRLGLILTIYEAKGLEFDDVLLYNFFKDSQASKEWRVVTDFLEKLAVTSGTSSTQQHSLVGLDEDILSMSDRPRPLTFDPNQHKVLNSELKHLYTAVTRARVNVWIFDEDMEKRAPIFEYFKARKLVRLLSNTDGDEDSTTDGMFAEESTPEEWIRRGDDFMKHNLYEVAAKCYNRGGNEILEKTASAHQQALVASRIKDNPQRMREEFLIAAEKYLQCQMPTKAAICLQNAREREFVAHLYEKLGQLERAGETYRRLRKPVEASSCFERLGKFNQAVEILHENEMYDLAIDTLRRYKMLVQDIKTQRKDVPQVLMENPPSNIFTEERLSYKSAEVYHTYRMENKMMAALDRLPKLNDRLEFLKRKGYFLQAAKVLQQEGRFDEAASLLLKHGKKTEAVELARQSNNKENIGQCLIVAAKVRLDTLKDDDENLKSEKEEITESVKEAVELLQKSDNKDLSGDALFLLGELTGVEEHVNKAFWEYKSAAEYRNEMGQLDCMDWMVNNADASSYLTCKKLVLGMENLFGVLKILSSQTSELDKIRLERILGCYGLQKKNEDVYYMYPKQSPRSVRILKRILSDVSRNSTQCELPKERVTVEVSRVLLEKGLDWYDKVYYTIEGLRNHYALCSSFTMGKDCTTENCVKLHKPHTEKLYTDLLEFDTLMVELDYFIQNGGGRLQKIVSSRDLNDLIRKYLPGDDYMMYMSCDQLMADLMPSHLHHFLSRELTDIIKSVINGRHRKNLKLQFKQFLEHKFCAMKDKKIGERKDNVDIIVKMVFFSHLLKLNMNCDEYIQTFELEIQKEFSLRFEDERKLEKTIKSLGFMCSYPVDERTRRTKLIVHCLPRRFWDAYHLISRMNNDPYESLFKFTKFLRLLGARNQMELVPQLSHFSLWLEFYTTVSLSLAAKLFDHPSYVYFFTFPASYMKTVTFVDASFIDGVPTLEAIRRFRPRRSETINSIHDRIDAIISIICGCGSRLNLLSSVQWSEKDSVFVEKLVILALTLMCNMGKGTKPDKEPSLMQAICRIKIHEDMPLRLATALKSMRMVSGVCDVAAVLRDLLKGQKDDLLICTWDHKLRFGISSQPLENILRFPARFFIADTLSVLASPHETVSSFSLTADDEMGLQDDECELSMEETYKIQQEQETRHREEEQKQKVRIIVRFLRSSIFKIRIRSLARRVREQINRERLQRRGRVFGRIIVDDTMCGICGINFMTDQEAGQSPQKDQSSDDQFVNTNIQGSLSPEQLANNPFASLVSGIKSFLPFGSAAESKVSSVRQEHEESQVHQQKVLEFHSFQKRYDEEMTPVIEEVTRFISQYRLNSDMSLRLYSAIALDVQKLFHSIRFVERDLMRIISLKDWIGCGWLMHAVKEIAKLKVDMKEYVVFQYQKMKECQKSKRTKAAVVTGVQDKLEDHHDDDEIHNIEAVVEEPALRKSREFRPSKGRGRGRGRGRSKRKEDS